ncbi:hypothetical protein [Micromonospora craterilacus]|uniref:hypothetical protein n=1 Tax=Micromonospora craterilacus TaxID=1655439 RepID=UPI0011B3E00A|nr:hypothetical protein [Micromonospora craterilacus]
MQRPRYVFLAAPVPQAQGVPVREGILWMLVSPNNRQLGRSAIYHDVYADCRQSVLDLQKNVDQVVPLEGTVEMTGQWIWRLELNGRIVAVSSRSYLRARECTYNLERFLEAVPQAEIVVGIRSARRGRHRPAETEDTGIRSPRTLGAGLAQSSLGQAYRPRLRMPGEL